MYNIETNKDLPTHSLIVSFSGPPFDKSKYWTEVVINRLIRTFSINEKEMEGSNGNSTLSSVLNGIPQQCFRFTNAHYVSSIKGRSSLVSY